MVISIPIINFNDCNNVHGGVLNAASAFCAGSTAAAVNSLCLVS